MRNFFINYLVPFFIKEQDNRLTTFKTLGIGYSWSYTSKIILYFT